MKKVVKSMLVFVLLFSFLAVATGCRSESGAPRRKEVVKIICPYGVGGTADAIARKYAKVAGDLYPEYDFIVEQKTGGDGFVAAAYYQNVDPNSKELFQLGYGNAYRHELGKQFGTEQVPFDLDAFLPIATVDDRTWIVYASPGTTLEEVMEKAKAGTLKMSGGNPLSDPHLALGSLVAMDGGSVTVVGYDGGAAQKQGLVTGEVDVFVGTTQAGMEEIEAGILVGLLAFSEEGFEGFVGPDGPVSVPGLVENKPSALDANKDYTGSILPAGGFIAGRTGADQEWVDKVIEISKAVWDTEEFSGWMTEIGLNRVEIYGEDAVGHMEEAIERAVNAYSLLSGN
ncbi:tripartite tricarboxylate transporter substrate-binding protein [Anaerotalea alkaliphila]|uniref:Tripartite tricarboxylate transporter substrate binding protein n=1 Tax=Anaerotalea alkaliphila TaxID=2662126 RepID=A0A7X5HUQ0_9FIRM|nr:tripartite tricarboxylate transporter substrate-binding protein [Anaerotalea alkaliphila]NDL67002.1 hypothetical protein [Anaerotalea alkaliphila]